MSDDGDDYEEGQLEQFESILDTSRGAGMESRPLLWHYRSQHESLIAFSNRNFYDGNLITFPSAVDCADDVGIEFFNVGGTYRRGAQRDNPVEARFVAERVAIHLSTHPALTVGVVAFSEAQELAIENEIERLRVSRPELDASFTQDRLHGFFVKNLESVQGDERDIIIFSVGYGPDENGKLYYNFGPINKPGGYRRLNVAITRARRRVEVVASMSGREIRERANEGVRYLAQYLEYAELGASALSIDLCEAGGDAESPFEEGVMRSVVSWGYDVVPQLGCAGYRLDLAVRDPNRSGNYVLAIECDGAMYHSSKVARDRDRLRQEVLERLGWRFHRIWGTAWYRNRDEEERRLKSAIEGAVAAGPRVGMGQGQKAQHEPVPDTPEFDGTPEVDVPALRAEIGDQYSLASLDDLPIYVDMADPNARPMLWKMIERIAEIEGPISFKCALQRCRDAFGHRRAGAQIERNFRFAVAETRGVEFTDDGFVVSASSSLERPRFPEESDPSTKRKVEDVRLEELELAVMAVVLEALCISRDELTSTVAALFGWERRGADIARALDSAVDNLVAEGAVRLQGDDVCPE